MSMQSETGNDGVRVLVYWLIVGIPLIWGIVTTLINAAQLFG